MLTRLCILVFRILQNPGPGTYNDPGIRGDGNYAASKYPRIKGPSFLQDYVKRPKKYDRVPKEDKHQPGPGWYDSGTNFNISDVMENSMTKSRGAQIGLSQFGVSERKVFKSSSSKYLTSSVCSSKHDTELNFVFAATPGPGAYLAPSAFGHYVAKKYANESLLPVTGGKYLSARRASDLSLPLEMNQGSTSFHAQLKPSSTKS